MCGSEGKGVRPGVTDTWYVTKNFYYVSNILTPSWVGAGMAYFYQQPQQNLPVGKYLEGRKREQNFTSLYSSYLFY